jgi:hypothetical protein
VRYEYYTDARPRGTRSWMVALPFVLFVLVALAWSGFWYYASIAAQTTIDGWREREGQRGRAYACASQTLSGYPFRIEVRCQHPDAVLRNTQPPWEIRVKDLLVAAQVYDPTLLISEFTGPLTAGGVGSQPTWMADWTLAQVSVRGAPAAPERVSIVFDKPTLQRQNGSDPVTNLARADHLELHGRVAAGTASNNPLIEVAVRLAGASAPPLHRIVAEPITGEIRALLSGLKDLSPEPWPAPLRSIQMAGGRIEITQARLEQAGSVVVGSGTLALTPQGQLDGQLQLTVVGLDRLLSALDIDIDRAASQIISQKDLDKIAPGLNVDKLTQSLDRIMPGLGGALRSNSGVIAAAGVRALGQQTTLEGRPAIALPLRFVDGVAFLGPLRVGELAPLF